MKGVLFDVVEKVVTETAGADAWDDVLDAAGLPGVYTSLGDYDHAELARLVKATAARLDLSDDAVLVHAGRAGFRHLVAHAPEVVTPYRDVAGLIEDLNDVIHPEARKLYPAANPPRFTTAVTADGIELTYHSARGLCALAEGLLHGAADHFGQAIEVHHRACTHRGDDACVLIVRVSSKARP